MGAFVDRTTAKRALIIAGAVTVAFGALAMPLFPHFFAITILQALTGVADSVFAPALAAITLGLVGTKFFARRVGRNQSFNHAGNGVQILDGVGAGIFGALFPLVVQDLTHGTGRFNVSLGAVTTAWGWARRFPTSLPGGLWSSLATTRRLARSGPLPGRAWRCISLPCPRPALMPRRMRKICQQRLPQMGEARVRRAASKCYRDVTSILRLQMPAKVTNTTFCREFRQRRVSDLVFWSSGGSVTECNSVVESLRIVQ
jgi:MFS family permease